MRALMDTGLDGALDPLSQLAFDDHLAGCAVCRADYAARQTFSEHLHQASYFTAPESLRARLVGSEPKQRGRWRWFAGGAWAGALAAMAASVAIYLGAASNSFERDMVAAHVHALAAERLTDVTSTDRHTVKPWFAGRIDLSPPVPDLADEGFPLVGGRLDHVEGRPAAALVYLRHRHVITLFAQAAERPVAQPARARQLNGYQMVVWGKDDMAFTAVSDLNLGELEEFQRLWAERAQ